MTYNTKPRKRYTKAQRDIFLVAHGFRCYWCRAPIQPGQKWHIEHKIARELGGSDDDDNLDAIHAHPLDCHKIKTRQDVKLIAKGNRIIRANGPVGDRRKTRAIPATKTAWPSRKMASKPFQRRPA